MRQARKGQGLKALEQICETLQIVGCVVFLGYKEQDFSKRAHH